MQGAPGEVARQLYRLEERGSILDTLLQDAKRFRGRLGGQDKARLDQYFNSVREVESRLHSARQWEQRPKPPTELGPPADIRDQKLIFKKLDLMLSMARLALESDSTRIVTLMVDAFATPVFKLHENEDSVSDYHNLSHHGQAPEKLRQLEDADRQQMGVLRKLIKDTVLTKSCRLRGFRLHGHVAVPTASLLEQLHLDFVCKCI